MARTNKPRKSATVAAPVYDARLETAFNAVRAAFNCEPTTYQKEIIRFAIDGTGHGMVSAVPGSGKSTTLEMIAVAKRAIGQNDQIIILSFGKEIATAMKERFAKRGLETTCHARTLNSLGYGILAKSPHYKMAMGNGNKPRDDKNYQMFLDVTDYDNKSKDEQSIISNAGYAAGRIMGLLKNNAYGVKSVRPMPTPDDIMAVAADADIDLPDNIDPETFADLVIKAYEHGIKNTRIVDWDDQLFLPMYYNMPVPTYYQFVGVDETQDLNPIQMEMVRRMAGKTTGRRCMFVGDEWQAIFAFRGADSEAMGNIASQFETTRLPLNISHRCPKSVVALAKQINPEIEASPTAKEGTIADVKEDDFFAQAKSGDMVVCRTTAPLVETVYQLIREGKKATIKGRDIGTGLKSTLDKIAKKCKKMNGSPWDCIDAFAESEIEKIKDESKAQRMMDRFDTLRILAEGCETFPEVKNKIDSIFTDRVEGIVLYTIHKAKGLEASRVWILHPELLPHPMAKTEKARKQEINLKYVAITRTTDFLGFVTPKDKKTFKPCKGNGTKNAPAPKGASKPTPAPVTVPADDDAEAAMMQAELDAMDD